MFQEVFQEVVSVDSYWIQNFRSNLESKIIWRASPTHSLAHSLTHSLTHSLARSSLPSYILLQ